MKWGLKNFIIYYTIFLFYFYNNVNIALCKREIVTVFDIPFPLTETVIVIGGIVLVGGVIIGAAPAINKYYASTFFFPVTHTPDYYLNRFEDIISGLLDEGAITEGQYLTLYNKVHEVFQVIYSNPVLSEQAKLQGYDFILFMLKNGYTSEILNGLPFS
jgi:hypothetical protein